MRENQEKKWSFRYLILLLMGFSCSLWAAPANKQLTINELSRLQSRVAALKQQLSSHREAEQSGQKALDQLEHKMVKVNRNIGTNKENLEQLRKDSGKLQVQLDELTKQGQSRQRELAMLVRTTYMMGRQKVLKVILSQGHPVELSRAMSVFGYLADSQLNTMQRLQAHQETLQDSRRQLSTTRLGLEKTESDLAADKQALESLDRQRRQQLDELKERRNATGDQLKVARQREQYLHQLLDTIIRSTAVVQPGVSVQPKTRKKEVVKSAPVFDVAFAGNRGKMPLPVNGRIKARYGERRRDSGVKWQGLLLESRNGDRVNAVHAGQVVFADWFRGFGQLIVLDHGNGFMTLYAHNSLLHTQPGDIVRRGQQISSAGTTGGLDSPGLYFEIRVNGEPDDPLKWCRI